MTSSLPKATHVASLFLSLLAFTTACGQMNLGQKKTSSAQTSPAVSGQGLADCFNLGNPNAPGGEPVPPPPNQTPDQNPKQNPNQGWGDQGGEYGQTSTPVYDTPSQNPSYGGNGGPLPVVINGNQTPPPAPTYGPSTNPGKGGPCQPGPGQTPAQTPGQTPAQTPAQQPNQTPCTTKGGCTQSYDPSQMPTPLPINPNQCGKGGAYCNVNGQGQWPTQAANGGSYDQGQVQACLNTFQNNGYSPQGQWSIDVRKINNVSVFSSAGVTDTGNTNSIVMIDAVNVLGNMNFALLNPNALYCIKNVSVFENVMVSSCRQSNVVFSSDVSVFAAHQVQVVGCP